MPKIKVELSHEVIDGQPITFIAPCDCSESTGLKVSYPSGSKEFVFKDSHGNDLTGITELFLTGAYVRVIIDTTNNHAYIQNADTNSYLESHINNTNNPHEVTAAQVGARPNTWMPTASDVGAVPTSRTVNGKALSSNITLSASDVGAVPTSRTVNGKALSSNITLSASDVGARPSTWTPSASDISGVGTNQVFSKLTDIGITTFPTTMSIVASSMPNNSTLIIDSRDIVSGGANEISDLGATGAGTYMIMRGNTTSRVQLLHIYGAATATTSFVEVGNYAVTPNTVTWVRALDNSDSNYGTASASNSYHTAYFAKIGKLVICTLLPKAKNTQALYSETITIPSGYRPSSGVTFSIFSDTAVNAGDSTGKATVSASTGGVLTVASTYGISVAEASKTYCWVTA